MSSPLRLAIIGCGDIARYIAFLAWLNRGISTIACCDKDLVKAQQFARRYRIPRAYQEYGEMLERERPGAIYLAVPHHLHYEMLLTCIEAGIDTLVEKPVTRTLAEGIAIARMAEASGVRVGVNYQYRYDRGCYALAKAVQRGDLGKIYAVCCNLPWQREQDYFEQAPWHARVETAGGGTLMTQGSHLLDIALWALPHPPQSATGCTARLKFTGVEVEDVAQGILTMADGALVQINSTLAAKPEGPLSIQFYGDKGTAEYSDKPWPGVRFHGVRVGKARPPIRGVHALQRSLEGFRAWVVEGRSYLTPVQTALPALAAVEAIYRSSHSGRCEPIQETQPRGDL